MKYDSLRALELLKLGSGNHAAKFRNDQETAIRHVVEGHGRLLVVQKTGWGKSFVYFIATKLLREGGLGPALLVSPLLALMRNQVAAAERMGVRAATINSDNESAWEGIEKQISRNEIDILIISPERLANERFRDKILASLVKQVSLLVVDEAHCISDWGHDFRPHYRLLERTIKILPSSMRVLATTATANKRVLDDLDVVLGPGLTTLKGDLNRSSLTLQTIDMPNKAHRLAWLAEQLSTLAGSGIIYALTIRDANQVAEWLKEQGFNVESYTGRTGGRREELEDALLRNEVKALVATTSLGMGYDKPDLSFVIHYQMPGSAVAYYQQVGRAGRSLASAYGVLLYGNEELGISNWFIDSAFPTRAEVAEIMKVLDASLGALTIPQMMRTVNLSQGRIENSLTALSLESPAPIAKGEDGWQLTANILSDKFWLRADRLTALRREELGQMVKYVGLPFGSHMKFLISALDGSLNSVKWPTLPPLKTFASEVWIEKASTFLSRVNISIEPRKRWAAGGLPKYQLRGNIPVEHQAEVGIALCYWGDSGWGGKVKKGRYLDKHFDDELLEICAKIIEKWKLKERPTWVTSIPSLRNPGLVPGFAIRLAKRLDLPFYKSLSKNTHTDEQKSMANMTRQALNVDGSLGLCIEKLPKGPVLLVDDIVNSGWTFAVATWMLRNNGCGKVYPFALSITGNEK
ncbi:DEAD/DEAH box helicase [Pseudomonas sp. PA-6-1D]|nr:DEAD/DEAH box helicase [Pseudomonas sp. PA-6-3C]MCF5148531.1 DEAD/DEAH box helicase [Pseudomonas sp. PA-6-3F]MCF5162015.1 DEAD/DEAH box helicase [Pseudomonas sp. PA-6-2E]MCF5177655.1 DEAD/DEAH box helicase [Pseudomonas sp. PA-6-1D]MCF5195261.1 DEAD/DEAH box helicase [Pseudomonas sp. PA-6-1H]